MENSIGIGIITRNRRETFNVTYSNIVRHSPKNIKLVVVDDNSDIPVPNSIYLEENVGIAAATNHALRELKDCDHIFIFNDDVYPIVNNWYIPYIESTRNHLCLSFELNAKGQRLSNDVRVTKKLQDVWYYQSPNGIMLYMKKECIDVVGGFDERFGKWGNEHKNYSMRIYNAGLTESPFMDIPESIKMFYSYDYHTAIESSVPEEERIKNIENNNKLYELLKDESYKVNL